MKIRQIISSPFLALLAVACNDGDTIEVHYSSLKVDTCRVAVVVPMTEDTSYKERYEQTVEWAQSQLMTAQHYAALLTGDSTAVALEFEWYDEDTEDLGTLASTLARRDDLLLTIGPTRSTSVEQMATQFARENKPLISPSASSEDIIRRYSVGTAGLTQKKPFLWTLCETDVSQCEALLTKAWGSGACSISLLVPDDVYGKTFSDWIPFVGAEMGLTITSMEQYTGTDDLSAKASAALGSGADCAICITQTLQETKSVLQVRKQLGDKAPRLLFSDAAMTASLLSLGDLAEGIEGVAQYADPTTGFQIAYEEHFGRNLSAVEAQLYDAVLLADFAATVQKTTGQTDVNEILRTMTASGTEESVVWSMNDMTMQIFNLKRGRYNKMTGASGVLRFDKEAYTSLVSSAYVHWTVYDGKLVPIDYLSTDGSNRTEATLASWNWQARNTLTIEDIASSVTYGTLQSQWAVLVQGSSEWRNYRHQADVLNMYQMLKRNGYPDDHIILIISDDIAYNAKNTAPGEVRCRIDGDNLYADAEIDYSTDTLTTQDICDILQGRSSAHLPVVLNSDEHSNVMFFWSGHGSRADSSGTPNSFNWRSDGYFTDQQLRSSLEGMSQQGRFRKMLMMFEPCYSQNMLLQAAGIPGVLCLSSAAGTEQSFADCYSLSLSTYLSDRFSNNLISYLETYPGETYKSLYSYLVTHTLGSHVQVSSGKLFDNLCLATPEEFVRYKH